MNVDYDHPKSNKSDRFILSKGHAVPALYATWYEIGKFVNDEEINKFRQIDGLLEGHPVPRIPFCDVGSGSLGQGLGIAIGMAYGYK